MKRQLVVFVDQYPACSFCNQGRGRGKVNATSRYTRGWRDQLTVNFLLRRLQSQTGHTAMLRAGPSEIKTELGYTW